MAKKYGIRNLAPKELAHFECDWTVFKPEILLDPLLTRLIDEGIWNGKEWDGVTNRVALLVAKAIYTWKR